MLLYKLPNFTFFVLFYLLAFKAHAVTVEDIPEKIRNSVFFLETRAGCASGFLLANGTIVTNAHVANGVCNTSICEEIDLSHRDPMTKKIELYKSVDFNVVALFPAADLAILKPTGQVLFDSTTGLVKAYKGTPRDNRLDMYGDNGISGSLSQVSIGEKLFSLGFPGCNDLTVTEHKVSEIKKFVFAAQPDVIKGASGGPVFNEKWELVGIVSRKDFEGNSIFPSLSYLSSNLENLDQDRIYFDMMTRLDDFWDTRKYENLKASDYFELKFLNNYMMASGYLLGNSKMCPELKDYFNYMALATHTDIIPPRIDQDSLNLICASIFRKTFTSFFVEDYFSAPVRNMSNDKFRPLNYDLYLEIKEKLNNSHTNLFKTYFSGILLVLCELILLFFLFMKLGRFLFNKFPWLNRHFWTLFAISQTLIILGYFATDKWFSLDFLVK